MEEGLAPAAALTLLVVLRIWPEAVTASELLKELLNHVLLTAEPRRRTLGGDSRILPL